MLTRGGPQSICYPTYEDILRGTGLETKGTVSKAVNRLEKIGWVRVFNNRGTRRLWNPALRETIQKFPVLIGWRKGKWLAL